MKKKLLTLLFATILSISLIACGGDSSSTQSEEVDASKKTEDSNHEVNETEPVEEDTNEETPVEEDTNVSSEVTIAEQEVLNQDGILITVTGLDMNGFYGPEIQLLIENNSEKNVTIQARSSSINGYMVDMQMSCDIVSGKKANDALLIMSDELETYGIDAISDIEFGFHIFDTETWDTYLDSDMITLTTSVNGTYNQQYDDSGDILYDNNGIRIISKGLSEEALMGPEMLLYIENNSDQNVTVQSSDTSIDGFMIETILSPEIMPGKKCLAGLTFLGTDLEANGITTIGSVETSFHIFNTDTWDTIEDTSPVVITLN